MQEMCALLAICHLYGHWKKDKRSLLRAGLLHKSGSHSFPVQQSREVYQPWVYVKNKSPQNTFSWSDLIELSQKKGRSWRNKQQGEALMRNELVIAFQALQLDQGALGSFYWSLVSSTGESKHKAVGMQAVTGDLGTDKR